jgi:hypothetical protein
MPLGKGYTVEGQMTGEEVVLIKKYPSPPPHTFSLILGYWRHPDRRVPKIPHQRQVHSSRPRGRDVQNPCAAWLQARHVYHYDPDELVWVRFTCRLPVFMSGLMNVQDSPVESKCFGLVEEAARRVYSDI